MHSARSAREAGAESHEREAPEFGAPTRSLHDGVVRSRNRVIRVAQSPSREWGRGTGRNQPPSGLACSGIGLRFRCSACSRLSIFG
jgi:hypothetical protein